MPSDDIKASVPNVARMYDYYLGGKDNFPADREAAERVLALVPEIRVGAQASRAFLRRAVRHLMDLGIDQFIDIGSGLPTVGHVHESVSGARVVYVDNDPVVLSHSRALIGRTDDVWVKAGDLREPEAVMAAAGSVLDLSKPVAILIVSVLHFVTDEEDPAGLVARYREALPEGGHLVLTHVAPDTRPAVAPQVSAIYARASAPFTARGRDRFETFLAGFDLLEPGIVNTTEWRPDKDPISGIGDYHLCAVGRKAI